MTLSLLFDTTTEKSVVAVFKDGQLWQETKLPHGLQSSSFLIPTIDELFAKLKIKPGDLTAIATAIGPGSYTGIRVGAMTAKVMGYALKIPLVGLCTLTGFIPDENVPFASIIDARIGGAYVQLGSQQNGNVTFHTDPELTPLDQLAQKLKDVEVIVTPQGIPLKNKLLNVKPEHTWKLEEKWPSVTQLHNLAEEKLSQGEYSLKGDLQLLYLRKTQAELEKKKR